MNTLIRTLVLAAAAALTAGTAMAASSVQAEQELLETGEAELAEQNEDVAASDATRAAVEEQAAENPPAGGDAALAKRGRTLDSNLTRAEVEAAEQKAEKAGTAAIEGSRKN